MSHRIKETIRKGNFFVQVKEFLNSIYKDLLQLEYERDEMLINDELDAIKARLDAIEGRLDAHDIKWSNAITKFQNHESRIVALEEAVFE